MNATLRTALHAAAALAAGGVQALALSATLPAHASGAAQILSLVPLAHLLLTAPGVRHAALTGWLYALAWLAGSFWWLFISMHTYGGLATPLAALAVLALAAFLALYYGAATAALAWCGKHGVRGFGWALAFASLWTLAELARARLLTGFPWAAGGYAHVDGTLAPLAPWVGVYGIGWLAALIAALIACDLTAKALARRVQFGIAACALFVLPLALPRPGADAADALLPMRVQLLQGNIPQDEKFVPGTGVADSLAWYGAQIAQSSAALVVAPETAVPVLPQDLPEGYLELLQRRFTSGGQAALLGIPLGEFDAGLTNSVIGIKPGSSAIYRYDKHHLVPFGEFIPPLFKWFVRAMNIPLGDFDRGALRQPSFAWQGQLLAPNICYEDVFGEELAARFADPAAAPTAFVNLSNIAWFGSSNAQAQHLAMSRMRALEFARPMLRATNTGATAIIDASGRVTHRLPSHTRAVLEGEFTGRTTTTPYARWASRAGVWPLAAFCVVCLAIGVSMAKRSTYSIK